MFVVAKKLGIVAAAVCLLGLISLAITHSPRLFQFIPYLALGGAFAVGILTLVVAASVPAFRDSDAAFPGTAAMGAGFATLALLLFLGSYSPYAGLDTSLDLASKASSKVAAWNSGSVAVRKVDKLKAQVAASPEQGWAEVRRERDWLDTLASSWKGADAVRRSSLYRSLLPASEQASLDAAFVDGVWTVGQDATARQKAIQVLEATRHPLTQAEQTALASLELASR